MATRFYFNSTVTPPNSPGFAAWDRTTEGIRRMMQSPRVSSAMTSFTIWANTSPTANLNALCCQFSSRLLKVGTAFVTTDTVKAQMRCQESGTNDNIDRNPICIKVYNGTTLQATLLALGPVGVTAEWLHTGLRNKTAANGDALTANYTTVIGDYLVIEIGGQVSGSGGSGVTGTLSLGSDHATTDLGENETDTTAFNPWFEISRTLAFDNILNAEAGSYALTGSAATLLLGRAVVAATGVYTLTGAGATFVLGKVMNAAAGSYALTGSAATLLWARAVNAAAGVYSLTGAAATLSRGRVLNAGPGSYVLTGAGASTLFGHVINAAAGSYVLTGFAATPLWNQVLNAGAGSYVLTGFPTTQVLGRIANAAAGSYILTGFAATTLWNQVLNAGAGSYVLTGSPATPLRGLKLNAAPGSYTLVGFVADLIKSGGKTLVADPGSYTLTGFSADLSKSGSVVEPPVKLKTGFKFGPGDGVVDEEDDEEILKVFWSDYFLY
jgi:hypothetical protein